MGSGRGLGNIQLKSGNRDSLKISEMVKTFELPKEAAGVWQNLRFISEGMLSVHTHWIDIITPKEKKEIRIPKLCLAFDADGNDTGKHCPYCELDDKLGGRPQVAHYINAIIRDIQENEPRKKQKPTSKEKKTGTIEINSDTWTPVRVVRITSGVAGKISKISQRNFKDMKKKKGTTYNVDDPKYGIDISIQFDKDASASDKYAIDKGERTPLSDKEKAYLHWDLSADILEKMGLESEEEAKKEFKKLNIVGADDISDNSDGSDASDESDDDSDDDIPLSKSKKKSKSSSKKKSSSSDKKKSKSKSSSSDKKKKSSSSDKKKSSSKSKSSSDKKKSKKKKPF